MNFRQFMLLEDNAGLARQLGDIYSMLQDLDGIADKKNQATIVATNNIIEKIRTPIKGIDSRDHKSYIEKLADIAVMLSKSVSGEYADNEKAIPLPDAVKMSSKAMLRLVQKIGSPINNLAVDDPTKLKDIKQVDKPESGKSGVGKATVPPSDAMSVEPTSPGDLPPDRSKPLGGSTGDLKNL